MILLCLIGQPICLTWTPYGIYGIFSRERWETVDPTTQTSWRLNSASSVPQAKRFHSQLTDAGVCAKGAPTKYWMQKWTYCNELELFCFAKKLFWLILGNILIFWDTGFIYLWAVNTNHQNKKNKTFELMFYFACNEYMKVALFLNKLQKKWKCSRYSNFLSCMCIYFLYFIILMFLLYFWSNKCTLGIIK